MKLIWKEIKIIKENHMKQMQITIQYENRLKRNENHKRKSFEQMKIIIQYENHMKRNQNN